MQSSSSVISKTRVEQALSDLTQFGSALSMGSEQMTFTSPCNVNYPVVLKEASFK